MNTQQLENELWEAADQLRANSKLTASEYAMPVLGLIFLRHASNRFNAFLPDIAAGISPQVPAGRREALIKLGFQGKAAIYLPEEARFEHIASLPAGARVGEAIDAAMEQIEAEHDVLQGALPRGYTAFEPDLLAGLVKIFDRPAIKNATGDVFGRIYEYFLNKFAMSGAQEGGEFFTPPSLVRMIVNIIEPDHGLVLDPACGSAGMFVQTGHFIEDVRHASALDSVVFHGQEKSDTNTKLARMNLAVHGLDASNIRQGNTFYEQIEPLVGACDFVMANPPFNVDGVETKKVEGQVGAGGRLPFGLPGTNAKTGAISNANSLWMQYFYSYLNATGRAGFVMASSASDAGNKDRDIREKLVRTGHVDVMVAIGPKFFYTRSLPCTLWFFDKGKPDDLRDQVLMLDARNVYHPVSARSHVFTEEQLANLNAIVWLYRGEQEKFVGLVHRYQRQVAEWLARLPERLQADDAAIERLAALLRGFAETATLAELNQDQPRQAHITQEALDAFKAALAAEAGAFPPLSPCGRGAGGEGFDPLKLAQYARELRKQQTPHEHALWQQLRAKRFSGFKFRRQQVLGCYIVDLVCFEKRLIVELDGGQHADAAGYDARRDAWLRSQGFRVLRFWNNEWTTQEEAVLETIWGALQEPPPLPNPSPARGEGLCLPSPLAGEGPGERGKAHTLDELKAALAAGAATLRETRTALLDGARRACESVAPIGGRYIEGSSDHHASAQRGFDALTPQIKALGKALEARHKHWLALLDHAEKNLRARLSPAFDAKAVREAKRALLAADAKKNEQPSVRDAALEALRQAAYFIAQAHWLLSRFPHGLFEDVPGLCKAVTREEIAANDWSLTPGRYVGVAAAAEDDEEEFAEKLREIHEELAELDEKAAGLAERIAGNLEELLG